MSERKDEEETRQEKEGSSPRGAASSEKRPRYALHLTLFIATCLSTCWVGARFVHGEKVGLDSLHLVLDGIPFAVALMGILLSHEMGHFIVARRHHVDATLPFFIPLPFGLVGTLGAVIGMPPTRNRNALVDIGAAGPLAGLLVAIPVLIYGLNLSPIIPRGGGLLEGNSITYLLLKWVTKGMILPGNGLDVDLHQVAWAGWVGLLITMLNLIPIGQLDGGHIAYAYFGPQQDKLSALLHRGLLPLATVVYAYATWDLISVGNSASVAFQLNIQVGVFWIVWWGLLHLFRRMGRGYHPPVDAAPLTLGRQRLAWGMAIIFVLLFTPIPLRVFILPPAPGVA
ncbi:MAG: site-2 protease family protein [Deltaproteobacteria bacterium]|nr:site-2 protease family protein [Deltaproteobacteria bacterium]